MNKHAKNALLNSSIGLSLLAVGFIAGKLIKKKDKSFGKILVSYSKDQLDPHYPDLYLIVEDEKELNRLKNGDMVRLICDVKHTEK